MLREIERLRALIRSVPKNIWDFIDADDTADKLSVIEQLHKETLNEYKKTQKLELYENIMNSFKERDYGDIHIVFEEIKEFAPIRIYPQRDIFIYDGYRDWCESFVFVDKDGFEKAIITAKSPDFNSEQISIRSKDDSLFFEDGMGLDVEDIDTNEYLSFLSDIPFDLRIVEEVEKVR